MVKNSQKNTGCLEHPVTKNLSLKKKLEVNYMSKHILKIMGALLVMALFVSISVGAVSADPINICSDSVQITDGMLALTYDVPSWPSTDPIGDFMPAASALGVLRETALANATLTYNASYNNATGAFTITDIEGYTAGANEAWFAFIDEVYVICQHRR